MKAIFILVIAFSVKTLTTYSQESVKDKLIGKWKSEGESDIAYIIFTKEVV